MNILYVSSVMAKKLNEDISKEIKKPTQYSIQKFHTLILEGLNKIENTDITVLSGLPISRKNTSKTWWKRKVIKENDIKYIHCPFFNLKIIKQCCISLSMFFETLIWLLKNRKKDSVIICDGAYVSVTPIVVFWAKRFKVKVITIVADIYDYMSSEVAKGSSNKKCINKIANYSWNNYDGFILITEAMNDVLNKKKVPHMIMEGIVDNNTQYLDNTLENKYQEKVCIYAGGLHQKYGVETLINAFLGLEIDNVTLHLYGNGDLKEKVENLNNDKIKYWGTKPNEVVVQEETKATLLINPRFTNQEYTKYSFPSKIVEYMSSGTPVLTTKLSGIPEEYNDYLYYINEESKEGMRQALETVLKKNKEELHSFGLKGKEFIINHKNNVKQAERIVSFIQGIKKGEKSNGR